MAYQQFGYPLNNRYDFLVPDNTSLCRLIEVWRKESKARYRCHDVNSGEIFKIEIEDYQEQVANVNEERRRDGAALGIPEEEIPYIKAEWFIDSYWYYYFLTPFGDILDEGETPYEHKEHPYVFVAYPFIDGEIHSFVADVIDQQRYVNRLIMLYDFIMKTSAKGVLLFPEDALPDHMSMDDIADEWARADGIIVFKPNKTGTLPKQIANNCTQIGISELLNIQLKALRGHKRSERSTAREAGLLRDERQPLQPTDSERNDVATRYSGDVFGFRQRGSIQGREEFPTVL